MHNTINSFIPTGLSLRKLRVLIVHESPLICVGIRSVLERSEVIEVVGQAVDYEHIFIGIATEQPDIVLLDGALSSCLPPYSAAEVVAQIRKTGIDGIVVFASSTGAEEEELFQFLKSGATAYILPTISGTDLIETIQRVANKEYQISSDVLSSRLVNRRWGWRRSSLSAKMCWLSPGEAQEQKTAADHVEQSCRLQQLGTTKKPDNFAELTNRELQILQAIADGLSTQQIGERFQITAAAVKNHLTDIFSKLGVQNRPAAVVVALRHQLISLHQVGNLKLSPEASADNAHCHVQPSSNVALPVEENGPVPSRGASRWISS